MYQGSTQHVQPGRNLLLRRLCIACLTCRRRRGLGRFLAEVGLLLGLQRLAVGTHCHAERLPADRLLLLEPGATVGARRAKKVLDERLERPTAATRKRRGR